MFENRYPIFKKGSILEKKELDLLRDNPVEIMELMYLEAKDGIIKGFDLETDEVEKVVVVKKGILKYKGKIYWLQEDYNFFMPDEEDKYILKLKLFSEIEDRKFYIRRGEFRLERGYEIGEDEIEIARFITRTGADLRNDYNSFSDLRRDFNLLEIINQKYSSKNERGTLHPKILEIWASEASTKENLDIFDVNFYTNCLQGKLERETIIAYINTKFISKKMDYSNDELYESLLKILENLGKERAKQEKKRIIPKKISIE